MIAHSANGVAHARRVAAPPDGGWRQPVRTLLSRLPWAGDDSCPPLQTLGLMSCSSGEGVSTIAAAVASELAASRREPVLLIDANFRRPGVHRLFDVEAEPGLAELLRDETPLPLALHAAPTDRLAVLPAGHGSDDPAVILDSPEFAALVEKLRLDFATIIVDLPPIVELGPTAGVLGRLDGLVLVVEAERTLVETVRQHKERLQHQARLLGVVLNKRRQYTPEWLDRFL